MSELIKLLESVSRKSEEYTHVLIEPERKKYAVDYGSMSKLYNGYCDLVSKSNELYLAEFAGSKFAPIIARFHLKYDKDKTGGEYFTSEFIHGIVACYQRAIKELFYPPQDSELGENAAYICFVLETDQYTVTDAPQQTRSPHEDTTFSGAKDTSFVSTELRDKDRLKEYDAYDIVLHFPFACVEQAHQKRELRNKILKLLRDKGSVIKEGCKEFIGSWEVALDSDYITKPILMYGSREGKGKPRLNVTSIIDLIPDNYFDDEDCEVPEIELESEEFDEIIKPERHSYVSQGLIKPDAFERHDESSIFWLPVILSVNYPLGKMTLRNDIQHKQSGVANINLIERYERGDITDLETAEILMDILNGQTRFGQYWCWISIGQALMGCSPDDKEKALNVWIKSTQKYSHRSESECRSQFKKFASSKLTVKTIAWYAREDNPKQFTAWHRDFCEGAIRKSINMTHTDVARAIHREYWLEYIATGDSNKNGWYEYRGHRWVNIGDALFLAKRISDDFVRKCEDIRSRTVVRQKETTDEKLRDECEKYIKGYTTLISKLKMRTFKTQITQECREFFYHEDAANLMDMNPALTGCLDGVIECVDQTSMPTSFGRNRADKSPGKGDVKGMESSRVKMNESTRGKKLEKDEKYTLGDSSRAKSDTKDYKEECKDEKYNINSQSTRSSRSPHRDGILGESSRAKDEKCKDEKCGCEKNEQKSPNSLRNGEIMTGRRGCAIFRPGKPEDFISKSTNISFIDETTKKRYTWDHDLVKALMDWITKVFPDQELREYFLRYSASILRGRNSDKLFMVFTGVGNNSKSMIIKLYEATLGQYVIKFPTSLFTGRRAQSSGPNPEIARAKNAKLGVAQEPGPNEELQAGIIKELTGGDSFYARHLHSNGGDVVALFKIILMCNGPPAVPNADRAVENRLRLVPFDSEWVVKPPEDPIEQFKQRKFKLDNSFEECIPQLAPAFLWLLTEYFERYVGYGISEIPARSKQVMTNYWHENDIYIIFINDCLYTPKDGYGNPDESAVLTVTKAYERFKQFYRDSCPKNKVPNLIAAKAQLIKRLGAIPAGKMGWVGLRIKDEVEDNNGVDGAKLISQMGSSGGKK
ncbi:MAG: VV D5-like helicase [Solumvirus sp.]|uniref:VV D5-like helicase n=1 Tax=Solumvirus sp. TaxID=2487773 RepID=A0A3G5AGW4_9VIRU|nr:MAG: VV D5-like helicase [Solumvirus sp.]